MDIIVCIKRVAQTADVSVKVDASGKDIDRERLTFDMNESDTYALEEAVIFKEKFGGTVTVISVGPADTEDTLRMALAKGADAAIRIDPEDFGELDGYKTAQLLAAVIKDMPHSVIFTGCMATDDGYYQVGVALAEMLGIPHATLVAQIDAEEGKASIQRELEGGLRSHLEMPLPALLTIQTGINVPRYASLIAIRRAAAKEIRQVGKADIAAEDLASNTQIEELFVPPVTKMAEILEGTPEEASQKLAEVLKEKGMV